MLKILLNSLINEETSKMLPQVQKRVQRAKMYISIFLLTGTKLVNRTIIHCIRQFAFQRTRIICTISFLKQFSDLLNSSMIAKSGDHSEEGYRQNIQENFPHFNLSTP